jgi:hypothetical protein
MVADATVPDVDGRRVRRFAVRVLAPGQRGTGWFVAPGWVLTCAHLVEGVQDGGEVTVEPDPPRAPGQELVWRPVPFEAEGDDEGGYLWLRTGQAPHGLSGGPLVCPRQLAVAGVVTTSRDPGTDLGALAAPVCALAGPAPLGTDLPELPEPFAGLAAEVVALGRAAHHRHPVEWRKVFTFPDHVPRLVTQPWSAFDRRTNTNPSDLLRAEYGVVPHPWQHAVDESADRSAAVAALSRGQRGTLYEAAYRAFHEARSARHRVPAPLQTPGRPRPSGLCEGVGVPL